MCDDGQLDELVRRLTDAAAHDDHNRIARLFRECIPSASVSTRPGEGGVQAAGVVVKMPLG